MAGAFLIYDLPLHATGEKQPNSNHHTLVRVVSYTAPILPPGLPAPALCR